MIDFTTFFNLKRKIIEEEIQKAIEGNEKRKINKYDEKEIMKLRKKYFYTTSALESDKRVDQYKIFYRESETARDVLIHSFFIENDLLRGLSNG